MAAKVCKGCGVSRPFSEFYKHPQMGDGHLNYCKDCKKADAKDHYRSNREQYQKYERNRNQRPERKQAQNEYLKSRRARYPEKDRARRLVNYATRAGNLIKQPCEVCGNGEVEAHHEDYSKPLEVRWLCHTHHRVLEGRSVLVEF